MIKLELKLPLFNKVEPISDKEESSRNIEVKGNVQHDAQDTSNLQIMFDISLVKMTRESVSWMQLTFLVNFYYDSVKIDSYLVNNWLENSQI